MFRLLLGDPPLPLAVLSLRELNSKARSVRYGCGICSCRGLVRLLASPEVFDRLTYHNPPKDLPEAVTEDWPRFLGPRHDLHSRETKLSKAFTETGPNKVWEMERGLVMHQ